LWGLNVIPQGASFGGSGDFEKTGLEVSPVSFVEGVVKAAGEDGPVPPVFLTVVMTESSREVFSSADIAGDVLDRIRVVTKEEIDAVAASLFSVEEASEGAAGTVENLPRPSYDARCRDTAGLSVNKEEIDVFSAHEVISSQGR
jgi:hypothetical protein